MGEGGARMAIGSRVRNCRKVVRKRRRQERGHIRGSRVLSGSDGRMSLHADNRYIIAGKGKGGW